MSGIPIADRNGSANHRDATHVKQIPAHMADFGDGPRLVLPARALHLSRLQGHGIDAPTIILLHPTINSALSLAMDAEGVREIAARLLDLAAELEAEAAGAAAALLRKVADR